MITVASVPLPFEDQDKVRQINAIKSWTLLDPRPEILLLADDVGTADAAREFECIHLPDIDLNVVGDLCLRSIFRTIDRHATYDVILYIDADTIITDDFMPMMRYVVKRWDQFVVVSGRCSAKVNDYVDFGSDWQTALRGKIYRYHNHGTDYYAYQRGTYHDMLDFSIGCGTWDGWAMWHALERGIPLVDVCKVTKLIHQDHGLRWRERRGDGRDRNKKMAGKHTRWLPHATVILEPEDVCTS